MNKELDYTKYTDIELAEMFGRMDPRFAPDECARLANYLTSLNYVVTPGTSEPGSAIPAARLLTSSGSSEPIRYRVSYGQCSGPFRWFEPSLNDFDFVGTGTVSVDGVNVCLSGRRAGVLPGLLGSLSVKTIQILWRNVMNVESVGSVVYFAYSSDSKTDCGIALSLSDAAAAQALIAALPTARSENFKPQAIAHAEFEQRLMAQAPHTPVTLLLVAINLLVFIGMAIGGAGWFVSNGIVQLAWGSNFGPYTTDGDWWRLCTSLFIHFGVLHLLFNMWALAIFGPMVERLYGGINYLGIYLFAGLFGGLASMSWQPMVNSAGASASILGVLGALLAAQIRTGATFPSNIVRPLRNATLAVLGWTFYAGFTTHGIDNAAHLGGLVSGFLLGLVAARPIGGDAVYSRSDFMRLGLILLVSVLFIAPGLWFARRPSDAMPGEGVYAKTMHWFERGERRVNRSQRSIDLQSARTPGDQIKLAARLDTEVLPFWRETSDRLASVSLTAGSPNAASLKFIQPIVDDREDALESLSSGLKRNDSKEIEQASKALAENNRLIADR